MMITHAEGQSQQIMSPIALASRESRKKKLLFYQNTSSGRFFIFFLKKFVRENTAWLSMHKEIWSDIPRRRVCIKRFIYIKKIHWNLAIIHIKRSAIFRNIIFVADRISIAFFKKNSSPFYLFWLFFRSTFFGL